MNICQRVLCAGVAFLAIITGNAAELSTFRIVTDVSELNAGDVVIIVNRKHLVAVGNEIKSTSIGATNITFSGDEVVDSEGVMKLTLEGSKSGWYLKTGTDYLCTTSSDKALTANPKKDDYSKAEIAIDKVTNEAHIAFAKKPRFEIGYNYEAGVFKTYTTLPNEGEVCIYKLGDGKLHSLILDGNDEIAANAAAIKEVNGTAVSRVKVERSFVADGGWYSLCLPFALTADEIASQFKGAEFQEFCSFGSNQSGDYVLKFRKVNSTVAGRPYLVRPLANGDVVNPVFVDKMICAANPESVTHTADAQGSGSCSLVGIYDATPIADPSIRFVGAQGTSLVKPNGDNSSLKGLRAYVVLPSAAAYAKVSMDGSETNGIGVQESDAAKRRGIVFDINGRRVGIGEMNFKSGIYIVDGKKIVIK